MSAGNLPVGPAVDPVKANPPPKNEREVELYKGEPPLTINEKFPMTFQIQEKCGFKDLRTAKKCEMKLLVHRVKNRQFIPDTNEMGGQVVYMEDDIHQYRQCPRHGPFPAGPESWPTSHTPKLEAQSP
jgi:hypothetical protein